MKNLWKKWELVCEKHNEGVDYVNYEDYTHPTDIFVPIFFAVLIGFICGLSLLSFKVFLGVTLFLLVGFLGIFFIGFLPAFSYNKVTK